MKKLVCFLFSLFALITCFPVISSAATQTTVTALMEVLEEEKQQSVYNTDLNAPFNKETSGVKESVSPETGEVIITNTVFDVPGRNNMDLALRLEYRSRDARLFEERTKSESTSNTYGQTIIALYDVYDSNGYWLRTGGLIYTTSAPTILGEVTFGSETWVFSGYLQYESGTALLTGSNITNTAGEKSLTKAAKYIFGEGWSLDIPSLDVRGDIVFVNLPNGQTYEADFSVAAGLKDYELTDIVFTEDETFENGADTSAYKLYYAGGYAYYFSGNGELLCEMDRFKNSIRLLLGRRQREKTANQNSRLCGAFDKHRIQRHCHNFFIRKSDSVLGKTPYSQ